jgi:molybdopterin molybdotransferase
MVTFEEFVRPALLKMAGRTRLFRPVVEARLAETLEKPAGRLHFVRVGLARRGDGLVATPTGNQSSGVLRSLVEGSGLLVFAAQATRLEAGARAKVQVLDDDFFAGAEPGI